MSLSKNERRGLFIPILFAGLVAGHFLYFVPDAFGSEGISTGRKVWDNVMLFVNFGILVFFFIKFARKPLMNFLQGTRGKIAEELDRINGDKEERKAGRDAEAERLEGIHAHLDEIRASILEMGEREKNKIIEEARISAEKMIQDARDYAAYRQEMAKKALSDEMVDMAMALVEEKIAQGITDKDNDHLINEFVTGLSGKQI